MTLCSLRHDAEREGEGGRERELLCLPSTLAKALGSDQVTASFCDDAVSPSLAQVTNGRCHSTRLRLGDNSPIHCVSSNAGAIYSN